MTTLDKRVMVRFSEAVYKEIERRAALARRKPSTYIRILIEDELGFDPNVQAEQPNVN